MYPCSRESSIKLTRCEQLLESLLPLENHLDVFFGVKAKCITETENVVKIVLRSISKQQLVDAGVAQVAFKL